MSSQLITELDENFSNNSVDVTYPHIYVTSANTQALPLIIEMMEEGDVPIYYTQGEETYELARVSGDPLNLFKLLRVYTYTIVVSDTTQIEVTDTKSLMEACIWTSSSLSS